MQNSKKAIDLFCKRFAKSNLIDRLKKELSSKKTFQNRLASSSWALLAALIHRIKPASPLLIVLPGLKAQEAFYQDLQTWITWLGDKKNDLTLTFFSAWERIDELSPHIDLVSDRLETLLAFQRFQKDESPLIVVANGLALLQKTFSPTEFQKRIQPISVGDDLDPLDLMEWLESQSYQPEAKVTQKGELALRGGIVDVFVPAHSWPLRIEFFGNEIESIRSFDPQTQLSLEKINSAILSPADELGIFLKKIAEFEDDEEFEKKATATFSSILKYVPASTFLIICEPKANEELAEKDLSKSSDKSSNDHFVKLLFQNWTEMIQQVQSSKIRILEWSNDDHDDHQNQKDHYDHYDHQNHQNHRDHFLDEFPKFEELQPYRSNEIREVMPVAERRREEFFEQIHRWLRQGYRVDVFCNNEGERDRFSEIWAERNWKGSFSGKLEIQVGMISRGFVVHSEKWVVLTDAEIFGRDKVQRPFRSRSSKATAVNSALEIDFSDLTEGDYVVHIQHGIGRFMGLQSIESKGNVAECLVIEYAKKDFQETPPRLFVPVTEAHLISKYVGAGKVSPPLNTLGGTRWAKAKARAKEAIVDLAGEMLAIAAARESESGHAFSADTNWQHEFESAFLYEETIDQETAITQTKGDMESAKPMDRLICGDVGFGKTEVAIRAAFKAVMNGKQVALLVPTTVLAQQHFNNWSERMRDYPICLELLSRFQTPRKAKNLLQSLAKGEVDIVIGTHRLLQNDVRFKDLGLVIIDEEQRFGVVHKDKFKWLRRFVDVLTLSATPIPRTLHMALIGARDMSTIQTPPRDRLPVQTIVTEYEDRIVRDAIQREIRRQGQVYFLHNRVKTIQRVAENVRALVPFARVVVGHGQMETAGLEKAMTQFVNGDADVLVSTTIIESGLDIPNANTILIDRADRFGLSDLYQLRGRVGRYKHQAYAYLFLPHRAGLQSDAQKRMSAMKQYSRLGSGFQIAMRDLEIRGAGNMLGPQQSGHITAVGFELYCQLLKQSIASLKGEIVMPRVEVHVKFDFISFNPEADENASEAHRASIPYRYVNDAKGRIEIYRKLAQINDAASLRALRNELRDRYGRIPDSVEMLLLIAEIKWIASRRKISAVETRDDKLMLTRNGDWVMFKDRFPRLKKKQPEKRLKEIRQLLRTL